jgi:dCMP deaminase
MKATRNGVNGTTTTEPVRPDWDDYWINIAKAVSDRSSDPNCKVGAVIVKENVLVSTGYNGFARDVQHYDRRTMKKSGDPEKLRWMCHAEQNAIYNAARVGVSTNGATIYSTKFPCLLCTHAIVQAGIKEIFTPDFKTYDDELIDDDGRRVLQVLAETHVRMNSPNLRTTIAVINNGNGSASH